MFRLFDMTPLLAQVAGARRQVVGGLAPVLAGWYGIRFRIVRHADRILHRQRTVLDVPPFAHARPAIEREAIESLRELDESGGMDLACEVFETFLATADHGIAQVESAISAGDGNALGQATQALKSSTSHVGAQILSGCYRELEHCARNGSFDAARALLDQVRREHARAVAQMRELLLEFG